MTGPKKKGTPAEVVLGIGSNKNGEDGRSPRLIIEAAVKDLAGFIGGLRAASIRETKPLHVTDQPPFLNTAVAGFYRGSPRELLFAVNAVEAAYGRDRSRERRWGERTLDIDILLFGCLAVAEEGLVIPHPRLKERAFALEPLLELVPAAQDPLDGVYLRDVLEKIRRAGV
ncbi:MAG: 2-amino-4-hydroxy-6-hydroxymethyldihydropteridine diphosphokinase [Treponema sp.]|jgi:2-amino-4-hydroxy-6-hydroxymethyldihydropteridine diphosphokinase|nr:2-amino-4-hydroxy-6-hydroxymethyldihydropteridine diphosphokinase [Treponema sp.]